MIYNLDRSSLFVYKNTCCKIYALNRTPSIVDLPLRYTHIMEKTIMYRSSAPKCDNWIWPTLVSWLWRERKRHSSNVYTIIWNANRTKPKVNKEQNLTEMHYNPLNAHSYVPVCGRPPCRTKIKLNSLFGMLRMCKIVKL